MTEGRWTVLEVGPVRTKYRALMAWCVCKCGSEPRWVRADQVGQLVGAAAVFRKRQCPPIAGTATRSSASWELCAPAIAAALFHHASSSSGNDALCGHERGLVP
jgi:hypothetical protein